MRLGVPDSDMPDPDDPLDHMRGRLAMREEYN